jgi:GNAT superfamily N-acetyltransferase
MSPEFTELQGNEESYLSRWCELTDVQGVHFFRNSHLPSHLFNFVTNLWHFPHGPYLVDQINRLYGQLALPHRLFFGPKEPQDLVLFFEEQGYALLSKRLIMVHDLKHVPHTRSTSGNVRTRVITEASDLRKWVLTALESWRRPDFPDDFDQITETVVASGLAESDFRCYLAEIDNTCVGTGIMNKTGRLAGIHAITTVPHARGQGVATTIIASILADAAAQGFAMVCLQTGKGDGADALYQRLGFRVFFELAKYGPKS